MDPSLYPRMAEVEDAHWWFAARRAICDHLLDRLDLPPDAAILEPGCGTGGNFPMLARRGRVFAMDSDESALRFAASRNLAELARGSLPENVPFDDRRFDLAIMTDVLEHLDDPRGSLRALHARLKPGGWLLLTVPALPWLWSEHDLTHHHRCRYRAGELRATVTEAGFEVSYLSHYNFILFPAIACARLWGKLRHGGASGANGRHDLAMPSLPLNRLLLQIFASEHHVIGRFRVPVGVSLIVLARA
ncbi:MAG TPA: class I SAM-dependent methyltransferase [Candidatus Binataceae bacterium]|nr:class I SAM-dependent methyltransferase [Candidatus Binataceae bacterium]